MKKLIAMLLAATMVVGLVGCGGGDKQPASSASAEAGSNDLQDISVVLDWYPNAIHTFMYVAQEKGYFAEICNFVELYFRWMHASFRSSEYRTNTELLLCF